MQTICLVALLFCIANAYRHNYEEEPPVSSGKWLRELEQKLELDEDLKELARPRRVAKALRCGASIMKYAMQVCEGACSGNTGIDMATTCCTRSCDDDYIRKACCPS
uniref:Uncharacterized protein n=1 Tax=Caenorhabditis japonica TaxID=281687 RepID=A0A8R1E4L4_CAEJA